MLNLRGQIEDLPGYGPSNSVSRRVAADIAEEADATIADLRAQLDKATKRIAALSEIASEVASFGCNDAASENSCMDSEPDDQAEWCLSCKAKAAMEEEG